MKKFYITLPIYYANGVPHIGHAYSSLVGDVHARYRRLLWYNVKFSVGTDENSQKIVQKAEEKGQDTMEFLDEIVAHHIATWEELKITNTDFIRTTEKRHKDYVTKILQKAYENNDFYESNYEWMYCVGCEWFKKDSDLIESDGKHGIPKGEKVCQDHPNKPISQLSEKNWFFKLSKYENFIKEYYKNNPTFIQPDFRFNEIKAFVDGWLEDFSISREGATFGIPLPFDKEQITYVWYDALLNYNTVCQNGDEDFWPADLQIMGKDIIRFHSIYYPAMLQSVGIEPPKQQLITGFLTADGHKMSKTLGNVVKPLEVARSYDRDALTMYLLYDLKVGSDGDFSRKRFEEMYASMLIGGWGNLVARVTKLSAKNEITAITSDAVTPRLPVYVSDIKESIDHTNELVNIFEGKSVADTIEYYLNKLDLQHLLRDWYALVQAANKFLNDAEPWKKLKDEQTKQEGLDDLTFVLYVIKNLAIVIAPLLINSFEKIQNILWIDELKSINTEKTVSLESLQAAFDLVDTTINLEPAIIYKKPETA